MKFRRICCIFVAIGMSLVVLGNRVQADLILSIESGDFTENSGVQTLKVFARSDAADQITSLAADLTLSGGAFQPTPGTFMQNGQLGFGSTGVSSFTRSSNALASLSLDFNMPSNPPTFAQPFPGSNAELATISFNVNGLTPGTYTITFDNLFALNPAANLVGITGPAGSFQISTVPEPSFSLTLLAGTATICGFARRGHKST